MRTATPDAVCASPPEHCTLLYHARERCLARARAAFSSPLSLSLVLLSLSRFATRRLALFLFLSLGEPRANHGVIDRYQLVIINIANQKSKLIGMCLISTRPDRLVIGAGKRSLYLRLVIEIVLPILSACRSCQGLARLGSNQDDFFVFIEFPFFLSLPAARKIAIVIALRFGEASRRKITTKLKTSSLSLSLRRSYRFSLNLLFFIESFFPSLLSPLHPLLSCQAVKTSTPTVASVYRAGVGSPRRRG